MENYELVTSLGYPVLKPDLLSRIERAGEQSIGEQLDSGRGIPTDPCPGYRFFKPEGLSWIERWEELGVADRQKLEEGKLCTGSCQGGEGAAGRGKAIKEEEGGQKGFVASLERYQLFPDSSRAGLFLAPNSVQPRSQPRVKKEEATSCESALRAHQRTHRQVLGADPLTGALLAAPSLQQVLPGDAASVAQRATPAPRQELAGDPPSGVHRAAPSGQHGAPHGQNLPGDPPPGGSHTAGPAGHLQGVAQGTEQGPKLSAPPAVMDPHVDMLHCQRRLSLPGLPTSSVHPAAVPMGQPPPAAAKQKSIPGPRPAAVDAPSEMLHCLCHASRASLVIPHPPHLGQLQPGSRDAPGRAWLGIPCPARTLQLQQGCQSHPAAPNPRLCSIPDSLR
ncbi:hypothetical protein lerEdw1_006022 [Lerista edwardsae]|nr:hypothetical protein lerEdw1_006022 [Lerista edwardsae]